MDYRKTNAPQNTETRNVMKLAEPVGNVYEMVRIISKRANQLSVEMKQDLDTKLQEFASYTDNLEEVFENHEQIEISRFYEKLPKPTLIAFQDCSFVLYIICLLFQILIYKRNTSPFSILNKKTSRFHGKVLFF